MTDQPDQINKIKAVCSQMKITYRELADRIGYTEGTIKVSSSTGNISDSMSRAIDMMIEIEDLKEQVKSIDTLKTSLKTLLDL